MNRFPRVPGVRPGYDPDEVDSLIKRIEATLGKGVLESEPVTADELRAARFRVRLGGYNEMAVDYALEAFIIAVENKDVAPRWARAEPAAGTSESAGETSAEHTSAVHTTSVNTSADEKRDEPAVDLPASNGSSPNATGPDAATAAVPQQGEDAPDAAETEREAAKITATTVNGTGPIVAEKPAEIAAAATERDKQPIDAGRDTVAETDEDPGGTGAEGDNHVETWFEEQAARVERVGFRSGVLGMGYNEDEVDAFLDRIVATLRRTTDAPLTPADVRDAKFSTVLLRPGYAIGEVDEFLAEFAEVIAKRTLAATDCS